MVMKWKNYSDEELAQIQIARRLAYVYWHEEQNAQLELFAILDPKFYRRVL